MSNTYYNAKSQREEDPVEALESFEMLLEMEEEKGPWGFKATKQIIKLLHKQKKFDKLAEKYKTLLTYMSVISRNDMEKSINNVLNIVSNDTANIKISEKIYSITITALKNDVANDRLWFNTKIKLGALYCDMGDLKKLSEIISELKKWCAGEDGTEDKKKSGFLLDIYVLEIQMYTVQNDRKRLKDLYDRCMQILSGAVVVNPRSTGIIRECGGKMRMRDGDFKDAYGDFFEAFKSYDDAGNTKRIRCLRYLVLASMLLSKEGEIEVNPFEASEVKPYKTHTEIEPMTQLISHFQKSRLQEFERVLKKNKDIVGEEFIKDFIPVLMKTFRSKILLQMIKPYNRINFKFIAGELNMEEGGVEELCIDLILDSRLDGQIDQMNSRLNLGRKGTDVTRYKSTSKWASKLGDIHTALLNKVN
jgi:COP9 signalosome complex subunit 2